MKELAPYEDIPLVELRDRVMDDLARQYSLGRIDMDDFERRTGLAVGAKGRGELLDQILDLPSLPPMHGAAEKNAPRQSPGWSVSTQAAPASDLSIAIFSGSVRKGAWQAPRRLKSLCLFGGAEIDLRNAIIPAEGLAIHCLCVFGGVEIIVPPDMNISVRGLGIMGAFEHNDGRRLEAQSLSPQIIIDGLALLGGVEVKVKDR